MEISTTYSAPLTCPSGHDLTVVVVELGERLARVVCQTFCVTNINQVAQLQVSCKTGSLTRDTLHQATVSGEHFPYILTTDVSTRRVVLTVCVVVDEVKAVFVVNSGHMRLCNAQADTIGKALAKRTRSDFNTVGMAGFRVTRRQGVNLTELLEVVH